MRRITTSHVLAGLALFIALGGTGYAAIKLPKNSVTTKQVKDRSLLGRDFRSGQLPRGALGPQGPQGPQGAPGPSVVNRLTRIDTVAYFPPGAINNVVANCPAGQGVVSGGFREIGAADTIFINDSYGAPSWTIGEDNFNGSTTSEVHAIAFCAPTGQAVAAGNKRRAAREAAARETSARKAAHRR